MSYIKNFGKEFPNRTIKLLENNFEQFKRQDLEVTFLLNCLLGLIVTKFEEKEIKGKVTQEFIDDFPAFQDKITFIEKPLSDLIRPIRNGIAHQHMSGNETGDNWDYVKIWNEKDKKVNFEIKFTIEELRKFALFIGKLN